MNLPIAELRRFYDQLRKHRDSIRSARNLIAESEAKIGSLLLEIDKIVTKLEVQRDTRGDDPQ